MTLYHYCPTEAFYSIISNKKIWLTSLSLSNDSMEGQLVKHILGEMAENDGLDKVHINKLQEASSSLNVMFDGLGFCLSEKKDILSQWRGYANDAYGVSIGFSEEYLKLLAGSSMGDKVSGFTLKKVIYNPIDQEKAMKPTYDKIKEFINKGAFNRFSRGTLLTPKSDEEIEKENEEIRKNFSSLYGSILLFIGELFLLKSKAFQEEFEWRLISLFCKKTEDTCSFYASSEKLKPYRSFELADHGTSPIDEIVLGPKNTTPKYVVESFLKQSGFNDVKISYSEASYR